MPEFRKKPVVIEARQYVPADCRDLHDWMGLEHEDHGEHCDRGICIETLEGVMELLSALGAEVAGDMGRLRAA